MSLTDELLAKLQGAPLQQVSQQLGISDTQASGAISAALPVLMGALGNNASQPQGAQALLGALQNNHSGLDLGSVLGSVLGGGGGGAASDGAGILGHIFGGSQQKVETGLAQATQLDSGRTSQLLQILAPIVMAFLASASVAARPMPARSARPWARKSSRCSNRAVLPVVCSAACWTRTVTASSAWAICSRSAAACWVASAEQCRRRAWPGVIGISMGRAGQCPASYRLPAFNRSRIGANTGAFIERGGATVFPFSCACQYDHGSGLSPSS